MFSLRPLLDTEIIIPIPINIATPIKVHATPMRSRTPIFQSPARRPPTRTTKPKRYMPAHFMTDLPLKSRSWRHRVPNAAGAVCMPANEAPFFGSSFRRSFSRGDEHEFRFDAGDHHRRVNTRSTRTGPDPELTIPFLTSNSRRLNRAKWQSGHAAACKAVYAGSIPTLASIEISADRAAVPRGGNG